MTDTVADRLSADLRAQLELLTVTTSELDQFDEEDVKNLGRNTL